MAGLKPPKPDWSRVLIKETDVRPPAGLKTNDAYDLYLCYDKNNHGKGVLVCKAVLQFFFSNGTSHKPGSKGTKLTWTDKEKDQFIADFKKACLDVWSDKHRITTTSRVPVVKDIGVVFEIKSLKEGWHISDHWELTVTKSDGFVTSSVNKLTGNSALDSLDTVGKWGPGTQRGAVHEFGHMIGLRDEYQVSCSLCDWMASKNCSSAGSKLRSAKAWLKNMNTNWLSDSSSVMNSGEIVRERHYAPFAGWLNDQFATAARLAKQKVEFKVNGKTDLSNAKL